MRILLFFVVCCLAACSKSNNDSHNLNYDDTVAPAIVVNTPIDNQVFSNGNVINVTGKVTDDKGLYRGTIKITNDANAAVVKEQSYEIHGLLQFDFNLSQTVSVTTPADYTVTVYFQDHGLNTTSKTVKIKVNP